MPSVAATDTAPRSLTLTLEARPRLTGCPGSVCLTIDGQMYQRIKRAQAFCCAERAGRVELFFDEEPQFSDLELDELREAIEDNAGAFPPAVATDAAVDGIMLVVSQEIFFVRGDAGVDWENCPEFVSDTVKVEVLDAAFS